MKNPYFHALLADKKPLKPNQAIPETIIELAYTWFGRPNWAYSASANKYWVGGVVAGRQNVVEYDIATGKYTPTKTGTEYENDDHNQVQLLIRDSDKRLLAVYAGHNSDYIGIRISTNPLDGKSWQSENNINIPYLKSYPSPYQASNGNIFIFFRAREYVTPQINLWQYIKSIDGGVTWGSAVTIYDTGEDFTPYLISCQDGNVIHFCATPGNPDEDSGLDTYHFSFDMITETAKNSAGTTITLPATVSNMTLVEAVGSNENSWILDIITKNGIPRILYAYFPQGSPFEPNEGKQRLLKYAEWNGTNWITSIICQTAYKYLGSEINVDQHYYTGVARFCQNNPDLIFVPIAFEPLKPLELFKYDLRNGGLEQLTFNSPFEHDNWRPISIPCNQNNLLWMYNLDYTDFTNYKIQLKAMTVNTD